VARCRRITGTTRASRIVSEFNVAGSPGGWDERHTVVFRDGNQVTFQNSGDAQAILDGEGRLISAAVWTKDGPQELPVGQLAFVGPLVGPLGQLAARLAPAAAGAVTAGALALYTWLSSRKERDKVAVLAFKAGDYSTGGTQTQKYGITFIGLLTRDEVKKKPVTDWATCKRSQTRLWRRSEKMETTKDLPISEPRCTRELRMESGRKKNRTTGLKCLPSSRTRRRPDTEIRVQFGLTHSRTDLNFRRSASMIRRPVSAV